MLAISISLRGAGEIELRRRSMDQVLDLLLSPIMAELTPGKPYLRWIEQQSNSASLYLTNKGVVGSYYILDLVKLYYFKVVDHVDTI